MRIFKAITVFSISVGVLLAAPQNKQDKKLASVIETGENSSKLLVQTLSKKMKSKLKNDGVIATLDFCAAEAYNITQKVNKELPEGVTVKRISNKHRSTLNAPIDNEIAVLESFQKMKDSSIVLPKQLIQKVDANTYKYYKPMLIKNKACLQCHGTLKDEALKKAIKDRYPLDNAMDYKMGDFRGAVVVTIKRK